MSSSLQNAKILFASLKAEKAKEIAEKLREIVLEHNISEDEDEFDAEYYWNLDNYIWEEAANLDDLIDEEKKELRKQDRDFPINK